LTDFYQSFIVISQQIIIYIAHKVLFVYFFVMVKISTSEVKR